MKLCLATNNQHKVSEIRGMLSDTFDLVSLQDIGCTEELAEDQDTIEGNSRQKAEYVFQRYRVACIADDSGLEVASLNGEPGVYSAMYAGPQRSFDDNIAMLLDKLNGMANRHAHFKTVITLASNAGVRQFEGIFPGVILTERRGTNGFGYDPVFLPDGHTRTLAEMTLEEKNRISHRSIAIEKLVTYLKTNKL
jgi:XTP/dITP diphosphohydrolase